MDFLRKVALWLAGLLCVIAISGLVSLLTLQTTMLDRTVVKSWLHKSGIYADNKLVSAIVQTPPSDQLPDSNPQPQAAISLPPDAIKTALGNTFTSTFIQTQTEVVVDAAYDWMEGKTPEFQFSIPINQKRDTFIQQLSVAIEPQIAALPECSLRVQSGCRTPGLTPLQAAQQLATQSIQESGAFTKPLTNKSISQPAPGTQANATPVSLTQLPLLRSVATTLLVALPVVAVLGAAFIGLMTRGIDRLTALSKLSRQVFLGMTLSVAVSIVVLWLGRDSDFGLKETLTSQASSLGGLLAPLVRIIIIGIATKLALFSGIACVISLTAWVSFHLLRQKAEQVIKLQLASADALQPDAPLPPFNNQY